MRIPRHLRRRIQLLHFDRDHKGRLYRFGSCGRVHCAWRGHFVTRIGLRLMLPMVANRVLCGPTGVPTRSGKKACERLESEPMLARLKSFFNPAQPESRRAPPHLLDRLLRPRPIHDPRAHLPLRVVDDHFEFGWEMGRIARSLATGHGFANPFNGSQRPHRLDAAALSADPRRRVQALRRLHAQVRHGSSSPSTASSPPPPRRPSTRSPGAASAAPSPAARTIRDPEASIALWSAWLWALYPAAMQYAVKWVWDMSLTAFLFAWVLVVALRMRGVGDELQFTSNLGPRTSNLALASLRPPLGTDCPLQQLPAHLPSRLRPLDRSGPLNPCKPSIQAPLAWASLRRLVGSPLAALCFAAVISPWVDSQLGSLPRLRAHALQLWRRTLRGDHLLQRWLSLGGNAAHVGESARVPPLRAPRRGRVQPPAGRARQGRYPRPPWPLRSQRPAPHLLLLDQRAPRDSTPASRVEAIRRINFAFFSFSGFLGLALALRRHIPGAWLFFWAFAVYPIAVLLHHRAGALPPSAGADHLHSLRLSLPVRRPDAGVVAKDELKIEASPQWLKPIRFAAIDGTAEAVP